MALVQSGNDGRRDPVGWSLVQWASEFWFPLLENSTSPVRVHLFGGMVSAKMVRRHERSNEIIRRVSISASCNLEFENSSSLVSEFQY